jgi:serine/threonine-protein kinase
MLASRWIMGGLLGQNEYAQIYEAEEAHQRRFAAIKLFTPEVAAEPAWGEHIVLTRALSELPGDGIARAYDFGIVPGLGRPYVASERITFPTLSRYVGERGAVPARALAQALATLSSALDAAHAAGIVHGGIKPQNVFISSDNPSWARLTDFSLARLRGASGLPTALLGWSAPEAAAGFHSPASDRYSLALVCFFAASGVPWYNALRGFEAPPSDRMRTRVASERAKSQGGEIDPLFDAWFQKALAADPEARFRSASEMAAAFIEVIGAAPTAEMPARPSLPGIGRTVAPGSGSALSETLPMPADAEGRFPARPPSLGPPAPSMPPQRPSSTPPPASVAPPSVQVGTTIRSAPPQLPLTTVPRWFWLGILGIAAATVLAVWWLGSK